MRFTLIRSHNFFGDFFVNIIDGFFLVVGWITELAKYAKIGVYRRVD